MFAFLKKKSPEPEPTPWTLESLRDALEPRLDKLKVAIGDNLLAVIEDRRVIAFIGLDEVGQSALVMYAENAMPSIAALIALELEQLVDTSVDTARLFRAYRAEVPQEMN